MNTIILFYLSLDSPKRSFDKGADGIIFATTGFLGGKQNLPAKASAQAGEAG